MRIGRMMLLGVCAIALVLGVFVMASTKEEATTAALRADVGPTQSPEPVPSIESHSRQNATTPRVARTRPIDPFRAKARARKQDELRAQQAAEAETREQERVDQREETARGREQATALAAEQKSKAEGKTDQKPTKSAASPSRTSKAGVDSGPSTWRGRALPHPNGGQFPADVLRWANLVKKVMAEHQIPEGNLEGILAQIQRESMGQPDVVNDWDSNAAKGTPAKGLLQIIAPTYQANAKSGFSDLKYQTVPYTNLWAALNYVKRSYGMGKFDSWSSGSNGSY